MAYFSETEIKLARQLRDNGLTWEPAVGHYVYDESGLCEKGSPFQERVYFILNHAYFMQLIGGVDRFKAEMLWLPTWEDLRAIIRGFGYSDADVAQYLVAKQSIVTGEERLDLYRFVDLHLRGMMRPQTVQAK